MKRNIVRVVLIVILIFIAMSFFRILDVNLKVRQIKEGNYNQYVVERVLFSTSQYRLIEEATVSLYKTQNVDCNVLESFSQRLLELNSKSGQARFFRTICKEKAGDLVGALSEMSEALKYDRYNTNYLLSLAILQLNLNNLEGCKTTLELLEKINPNTENLDMVQDLLKSKIKQ